MDQQSFLFAPQPSLLVTVMVLSLHHRDFFPVSLCRLGVLESFCALWKEPVPSTTVWC